MVDRKQELLDLLKQAEKNSSSRKKSKKTKTHLGSHPVFRFIKSLKIQPGNNRVANYKIYYEFTKWRGTGRDSVSKREFFLYFSTEFESKRSGAQRYYLLNDCFDLSKEAMKKAWNHGKRYQDLKKEKKVWRSPKKEQGSGETE